MNGSIRVLHLEDSPRDAELIRDKLETGGLACDIVLVSCRQDFESALATDSFDLVLCDYNLPDCDGKTALKLAGKGRPLMPVILISGTLGEEEAVECLKIGATDYVLKQRLERLVPSVRRALQEADERRARIQAERSLQQSEARLRTLVEASSDWIWEVDAQARYTYASPQIQSLLGYAPAEILGRTPFDLMPEEEARRVKAVFARIAAERQSFAFLENVNLHQNGQEVTLESNGVPVFGSAGEFEGYLGMDRDISKRKRAEESLRASEAEFRAMFELASIGMAQSDVRTGQWVRVNQKMCAITGYSEAEMLQLRVSEITHPDDRGKDWELFQRVVRGAAPDYRIEKRYLRKDGTVAWVNVNMTVIRDGAGQPLRTMATIEDITEQKKLEAQFLRAQRMEGIGLLASGLAHDLNNILAPIMMAASILRSETLSASDEEIVSTIESNAQRGADIIRQLLTFGRGIAGERVVVQVRHLVKDMAKIARETFPKNISFQEITPPDLWPVLGDATHIHQILLNLCINARDAMPAGGSLTLQASNVTLDELAVSAHIEAQAGPYLLLQVVDTGHGMPPEVIEKIFDPFFTTKPLGQGTGLGLSTVLGIVKSHGGFVEVQSTLGKGSTFSIYLPATPNAQTAAEPLAASVLPCGHGELILVADDEPHICNITRTILERAGYTVETAGDGAEAIAVWTKHRTHIQAVLTDIMMPIMDGLNLVRVLRRTHPQLAIIVSSGLGAGLTGDQQAQLQALGVTAFLTKPYSAKDLLETLQKLLPP